MKLFWIGFIALISVIGIYFIVKYNPGILVFFFFLVMLVIVISFFVYKALNEV